MTKHPPHEDITPYYKGIGFLVLVGTFGLQGLRIWKGQPFEWTDFGMAALAFLALLALIRPTAFDGTIRRLASWMPWTKYGKPPSSGD